MKKKNMKLNVILAGLMLGASAQHIQAKPMTTLDEAIHAYLTNNKEYLSSLDKIDKIKTEILELLESATEDERAAYQKVIDHFNDLDTSALMRALLPFKKALTALKEVNKAAYQVIKDNLPKMVAAFV